MNTKTLVTIIAIFAIAIVLVVGMSVVATFQSLDLGSQNGATSTDPVAGNSGSSSATSSISNPGMKPAPVPVPPNNSSGLKLGDVGTFNMVSIRPISVEEDSRCPSDVTCVWAGTVRLKAQIISGMGTSDVVLSLGQDYVIYGVRITLTGVTPGKNSKTTIGAKDYRFIFKVVKDTQVGTVPQAKCFVGGCSSQICSDNPNAMSTCEYTESYACYRTATCERQSNGSCGWTETAGLRACLKR
jgi:hypothetical protein